MDSISVTQIEPALIKDESLIPEGPYCYTHTGETRMVSKAIGHDGEMIELDEPIKMPSTKKCSYWRFNPEKEEMDNGYCAFLGAGDGDSAGGEGIIDLLWDQVKACGVNDEN